MLPREVLDHEPPGALFAGDEGLDCIAAVVRGATEWLRPGGALVVEHAPAQSTRVRELATAAGLLDAHIGFDLNHRPRVLVARCP
jgi:release factor glutamine methyltransferase